MQVLQQRVAQEVLVGGVADDRADRVEPGFAAWLANAAPP